MLAAGECSRTAMRAARPVRCTRVIEVTTIDEHSVVGFVVVVVETNVMVMPVVAPVVPAPAKTTKETDSKAEAKRNSRTGKVKSRIRIPSRPDPDRLSIYEPRIILRNVNDLRIGWFDHNGLPLLTHFFLRCTL